MKATVSFCGLILGLLLTFSSNVFAVSQLKIVCDVDGEKIYVDGKFKSACDANEPVLVLVSPGKHVVKVKKFNKDGSYYYFRRVIRIGDGIRMTVSVKSEKKYTERYYYNKVKKSGKIEDYWEYLRKFPHGRHARRMKKVLKEKGWLVEVWDRIFEGEGYDRACSVSQTKDGGYIVTGSNDGDVWVIKLDKNGNKVWDRTFGGKNYDIAYSIVQTKDGGYIVAGYTESKGAGNGDAWLIKLDKNGNKVWDRTFGGKNYDTAYSITQTKDGGYIVAGHSSTGYDSSCAWVIKLDEKGNKVWSKTFRASVYDNVAYSVIQTKDGGYAVAGWVNENDNKYRYDAWVIKLDEKGNKVWSKTFKIHGYEDRAWSIIQTTDGGYAVAASACLKGTGDGHYDAWVIKLDKNGNKVWDRTFGGKNYDRAYSITQTKDGGYIVAGYTMSKGAGEEDAWLIKLDKNGNKVWDRTFGGKGDDTAYSIIQTKDGGYIVAGFKSWDVWVMKLVPLR